MIRHMKTQTLTSEQAADRASWPRWQLYALLFCIAGLTVLLDQVAKVLVTERAQGGQSIELLGGALRLVATTNTGAAFSLFRSGGPVFTIVAVIVAVGIVGIYGRLASAHLSVLIGLALILGGATGNLIDRVRLGHVIDFIDLGWWPVFNLADSAIVLGVATLVVASMFFTKGEQRA
jgi:signal peptidase II